MNLIERFPYEQLERITRVDGVRHYVCPSTGRHLPSVTTILDGTAHKPQLIEWRKRVGEKKADEEKRYATALGGLLHTHLEKHILGEERPGGNNHIRVAAKHMADQIIHRGLFGIDEVWGSEVMLYVPGVYAGTTDVAGVYKGRQAIMDFKTAKKLRTRQMIDDYFHQLAAYAMAHDELYGTAIDTGVIFMVTRDCEYQEFHIEHDELEDYKVRFLRRYEQYSL